MARKAKKAALLDEKRMERKFAQVFFAQQSHPPLLDEKRMERRSRMSENERMHAWNQLLDEKRMESTVR
jgi:hypothetical protein